MYIPEYIRLILEYPWLTLAALMTICIVIVRALRCLAHGCKDQIETRRKAEGK